MKPYSKYCVWICAWALASTACSTGGLSKSVAAKVLRKRFNDVHVGTCRLSLVRQESAGSYTITDDSGSATACFDQVVKAGFGKRGACLDSDGATADGTCARRSVEPTGKARGHKDGFLIPCGTLTLLDVLDLEKTEERVVVVTYRREFKTEPVADHLGYCRDGELFMPDRGTRTKKIALSRRSDGSWGIVKHLEPFGTAHLL